MISLTASDLRRGRDCRRKLARAVHGEETPQFAVALEDWRTLVDVYRSGPGAGGVGQRPGNYPVWDAGWDPAKTVEALRSGKAVDRARLVVPVPEAGARIFQDIDRMTPGAAGYGLVLIRPAVRVRGEIHTEAAVALRALEALDVSVDDITAVYANRTYVRGEQLDGTALLREVKVTRQARSHLKQVNEWIGRLPNLKPGLPVPSEYRCGDDHCELCAGAKASLPVDHVRHLLHGAQAARELTALGVERMEDIPEEFTLTAGQERQVAACTSNRVHVLREKVADHLSHLDYPVGFLDFEAVSRIVPRQPGVRVGQHVPFLFSLHLAEERRGTLSHVWAGEGDRDPVAFVEVLLSSLEGARSVAAFGAAFERRMLHFLAERVPEAADRLIEIGDSLVDMATPFQRVWVYHPEQRGSLSLKRIAYALAGVTYGDLELADGGAASSMYARAQDEDAVSPELMAHLVEYCSRDTQALAQVVGALHELVEQKKGRNPLGCDPR